MRVYIGPYPQWIGPYQIADWLQYVGVSADTCHKIGGWLSGSDEKDSVLMKLCTWFAGHNKQFVHVHIDKHDTWSMDSTLATIILPMLIQLRDTKHGSPASMDGFQQTSNNAQFCFDFYEEGDSLAAEAGHQQWKDILNEMIWTFEQIHPGYDWEDQYWLVHPKMDMKDYPEDEGKTSIPVRWEVQGEADWEGMRAHSERIQRGLDLFGKYYTNLWD